MGLGSLDALSVIAVIEKAYDEVVHWKMNSFPVPFGKAGKQFVSELARLYRAFTEGSDLESIYLKAATVLTTLALLHKPCKNSKAKAHSHYLDRRLASWLNGDIDNMLNEGHTIQNCCFKRTPTISRSSLKHHSQPDLARKFAKLMFRGKYGAPSALLSEEKTSGVLSGETVSDVLKVPLVLLALRVWMLITGVGFVTLSRRLLMTFVIPLLSLLTDHRLCTQVVDHSILAPLLACRLIALDKNPRVCPAPLVFLKCLEESSPRPSSVLSKDISTKQLVLLNFVEDKLPLLKPWCTMLSKEISTKQLVLLNFVEDKLPLLKPWYTL